MDHPSSRDLASVKLVLYRAVLSDVLDRTRDEIGQGAPLVEVYRRHGVL